MKLRNLTHYRSDHLRAIIQRVASEELEPAQRKYVTVHVLYVKARKAEAKRARRLGFRYRIVGAIGAGLRYNQAIVRVQRDDANKAALALQVAHEFAECRGLTHERMRSHRYRYREGWQQTYGWAEALPLEIDLARLRPRSTKLRTQPVERKLVHARTAVARWRTRLKRARTMLAKAERRFRRLERAVPVLEGQAA